jgi:hypothetical protein
VYPGIRGIFKTERAIGRIKQFVFFSRQVNTEICPGLGCIDFFFAGKKKCGNK